MSLLSRIIGRAQTAPSDHAPQTGPRPLRPVFAIGDLHGRADLLERMLEVIDDVIGDGKIVDPLLVFLGDIIDRGPDSAIVMHRMRELTDEFPNHVASILGNHEQMMLDFFNAPATRYARWMRNGGVETCMSFGVAVDPDCDDPVEIADALAEAVGRDLLNWLSARPLRVSSGTLNCVHAAADPDKPIDRQADRVLIWGHPQFLSRSRSDGHWIAHGHTVFDAPCMGDNRISVDTGAYYTGTLSASLILPNGEVSFLTAQ